MTSSAVASKVAGTSMPRMRAVCMLMTNSNLVARITRQVCGLLAFEDAGDIDAGLAEQVDEARSVAHQPARFDELAPGIDRWHRVASPAIGAGRDG